MALKSFFKIIIIIIVASGVIVGITTFVPCITPAPQLLYRGEGSVDSGFYLFREEACPKGQISFRFSAFGEVNAFIMNKGQYYAFHNAIYSDSLSAINSAKTGTLSCTIEESKTLYFLIENDSENKITVTTFEVKYIGEKISILQHLRNR